MNKSELNVFRYGKIKTHTLSGLLYNTKQFFRNIKYAWQRIIKGYGDCDTWDLDVYYTKLMIDTLTHLRDNSHSFPGNEEWKTEEDWYNYLTEIIIHLKNYLDEEAEYEYRINEINIALKMLGKCWNQLWD